MNFLKETVLILGVAAFVFTDKEDRIKYTECIKSCRDEYRENFGVEDHRDELRECIHEKCLQTYKENMYPSHKLRLDPLTDDDYKRRREERRQARLQGREEP